MNRKANRLNKKVSNSESQSECGRNEFKERHCEAARDAEGKKKSSVAERCACRWGEGDNKWRYITHGAFNWKPKEPTQRSVKKKKVKNWRHERRKAECVHVWVHVCVWDPAWAVWSVGCMAEQFLSSWLVVWVCTAGGPRESFDHYRVWQKCSDREVTPQPNPSHTHTRTHYQ